MGDITVIVVAFLGGALAVVGLFRPFLGLLVLMTLHFVQPGEMVPALAPLRIELVYTAVSLDPGVEFFNTSAVNKFCRSFIAGFCVDFHIDLFQ